MHETMMQVILEGILFLISTQIFLLGLSPTNLATQQEEEREEKILIIMQRFRSSLLFNCRGRRRGERRA